MKIESHGIVDARISQFVDRQLEKLNIKDQLKKEIEKTLASKQFKKDLKSAVEDTIWGSIEDDVLDVLPEGYIDSKIRKAIKSILK